jgi:hypothetical protein
MKKNLDIVPSEERIINAGYLTLWLETIALMHQAEAEYSRVSGEYYALTGFCEYVVQIEYSIG